MSLADFAGQRVIVYFYPAAMTAGCTTQAVDFTAAMADLATPRASSDRSLADVAGALGTVPRPAVGGISLAPIREVRAQCVRCLRREAPLRQADRGRDPFHLRRRRRRTGTGIVVLAQYNVKATGHVDKLKRELGLS